MPEITAIQLPPQTTPIPLQSVLDVRWGGATTDRMSICGASVVADLRVAMDPRSRAAIRLLEACIYSYSGASSIHIAKRVDECRRSGLDVNAMCYPVALPDFPYIGAEVMDGEKVVAASLMPLVMALVGDTKAGATTLNNLAKAGVDPSRQFITFAGGRQLPFYQYVMGNPKPVRDRLTLTGSGRDQTIADPEVHARLQFDHWFRKYAVPPSPVIGGPAIPLLDQYTADSVRKALSAVKDRNTVSRLESSIDHLTAPYYYTVAPVAPEASADDLACPYVSAGSVLGDGRHWLAAKFSMLRASGYGSSVITAVDRAPALAQTLSNFRFVRYPSPSSGGLAFSACASILAEGSTASDAWRTAERMACDLAPCIWQGGGLPARLAWDMDGKVSDSTPMDEMVMLAAIAGVGDLGKEVIKDGEASGSAMRAGKTTPDRLARATASFEATMDASHPDWRSGISSAGRPYADLLMSKTEIITNRRHDMTPWADWTVQKAPLPAFRKVWEWLEDGGTGVFSAVAAKGLIARLTPLYYAAHTVAQPRNAGRRIGVRKP